MTYIDRHMNKCIINDNMEPMAEFFAKGVSADMHDSWWESIVTILSAYHMYLLYDMDIDGLGMSPRELEELDG